MTLKGPFLVSRYVAEQMVKQGRGGVIVNVASTSGLSGRTDAIAYMAAKGGVVNLSRGMAVQLSQYNIRVNCLTPNRSGSPASVGQDEGAEGREFKNLAGRLGTADDQAKAMLFLASDDSGFVWGENLICDGRRHRGLELSQGAVAGQLNGSPKQRHCVLLPGDARAQEPGGTPAGAGLHTRPRLRDGDGYAFVSHGSLVAIPLTPVQGFD